jgi:hypothetical protein
MRRRGRAGDFGEVVDLASPMHELLQQIVSWRDGDRESPYPTD